MTSANHGQECECAHIACMVAIRRLSGQHGLSSGPSLEWGSCEARADLWSMRSQGQLVWCCHRPPSVNLASRGRCLAALAVRLCQARTQQCLHASSAYCRCPFPRHRHEAHPDTTRNTILSLLDTAFVTRERGESGRSPCEGEQSGCTEASGRTRGQAQAGEHGHLGQGRHRRPAGIILHHPSPGVASHCILRSAGWIPVGAMPSSGALHESSVGWMSLLPLKCRSSVLRSNQECQNRR
jgi:hypothetical protein